MPRLTVSFCIPTHARPRFLREALESGLAQTRRPDEILVSDDMGSDNIRAMVSAFARRTSVPVRYVHCVSGQSLADNINHCLREAACDLILLLHDDDLLTDRAIELLAPPFEENPEVVAAFGKQIFITDTGGELPCSSENCNRNHRRSASYAGVQVDAVLSGIWQQFPNDGYMVKASIARKIQQKPQYQSASEVDFGIRCGEEGLFYFVDEYTSKYRLSDQSLSRGEHSGHGASAYHAMHIFLRLLETHPRYQAEIEMKLREISPRSVCIAIKRGQLKEATEWYFGPYHRNLILTLGGIRRGLRLMKAWAREGIVGESESIEERSAQKAF